ncbi:winged helix-turn-helix domain-containing protein [Cohnella sp. GCM10027633]|uniref:winged helix-turn-helix domain-containing protein n=1 Tax=unclassified Cohnella TaxID=2636738 RepID=UPI0036400857
MNEYRLTKEQARKFLLLKHGLLGGYKFRGKDGVLAYAKQAGCIQYDPIDVCGKNAELVLQSRVADFTKEMLYRLLYEERKLVDYFDKQLAIVPVDDWRYFARSREMYRQQGRSRDKVEEVAEQVKAFIRANGPASSKDVPLKETVDWSWSPTTLSRAVLETLYFRGDLIVHHKKGTIKHYALSEDHIDASVLAAADPNADERAHAEWFVRRRIGAVGLLWNKPSDAFLGIDRMKAGPRNEAFAGLIAAGRIVACAVEGIKESLYALAEDEPILREVIASMASMSLLPRVEFIAPLDNLLWDRNLIRALFDFDYKWEIYTPVVERKYGYYVLPVLYGDRFVGRIELVADKKAKRLKVLHYWPEEGAETDEAFGELLRERIERFAAFNGCGEVVESTR